MSGSEKKQPETYSDRISVPADVAGSSLNTDGVAKMSHPRGALGGGEQELWEGHRPNVSLLYTVAGSYHSRTPGQKHSKKKFPLRQVASIGRKAKQGMERLCYGRSLAEHRKQRGMRTDTENKVPLSRAEGLSSWGQSVVDN